MVALMLAFGGDNVSRSKRSRTKIDGGLVTWGRGLLSKPMASLRYIRILLGLSVTNSVTKTNKEGAPDAPCAMPSQMQRAVGVQKT